MTTPKKTVEPNQANLDMIQQLTAALAAAINQTKPIEKKNPMNRKVGTPWTPKDGSPKHKLKRKMYQHGLTIDPEFISNEEIDLLNKLKVGRFCDGLIKVYRRKDNGVSIDWPVRTASQRLKIGQIAGGRGLAGILAQCIEEAANPAKYTPIEED